MTSQSSVQQPQYQQSLSHTYPYSTQAGDSFSYSSPLIPNGGYQAATSQQHYVSQQQQQQQQQQHQHQQQPQQQQPQEQVPQEQPPPPPPPQQTQGPQSSAEKPSSDPPSNKEDSSPVAGEKRKRGRPKGSKTKRPKVDVNAEAMVSAQAPHPYDVATVGPSTYLPTYSQPHLESQAAHRAQALLYGPSQQSTRPSLHLSGSVAHEIDINRLYEFHWKAMNLCSEFYQAASDLINATPASVLAQAFHSNKKSSPLSILTDAKALCDSLMADPGTFTENFHPNDPASLSQSVPHLGNKLVSPPPWRVSPRGDVRPSTLQASPSEIPTVSYSLGSNVAEAQTNNQSSVRWPTTNGTGTYVPDQTGRINHVQDVPASLSGPSRSPALSSHSAGPSSAQLAHAMLPSPQISVKSSSSQPYQQQQMAGQQREGTEENFHRPLRQQQDQDQEQQQPAQQVPEHQQQNQVPYTQPHNGSLRYPDIPSQPQPQSHPIPALHPGQAAVFNSMKAATANLSAGNWSTEETRKLKTLVEQSKANDPKQEVDWDWVAAQFGSSRSKQMILFKANSLKIKSGTTRKKRKSPSRDSSPIKMSWAAVVPSKNPAPPGPPAVPGPPTPSSRTATYSPPQGHTDQQQQAQQRPVPPPTYNPPPMIQAQTPPSHYRPSHLASPSMSSPSQMIHPTQGFVQPAQQPPSRSTMHLLPPQSQQSMSAPPPPQSQTHFPTFTSSPRGNAPLPVRPPATNGPNVGTNQQGPPRFIHYHQASLSESPAPTAPPPSGPSATTKGKTKAAGSSATMGGSSGEGNGKVQPNTPVAGGPPTATAGSGPRIGTTSGASRPGSSAGASTGGGQYGAYA